MAVEVDPIGAVDQPVLVERPRLDARLDEHVERALDVDDPHRVAERPVRVPVLDEAPDEVVQEQGAHEQNDLPEQIHPTTRQEPRLYETEATSHVSHRS